MSSTDYTTASQYQSHYAVCVVWLASSTMWICLRVTTIELLRCWPFSSPAPAPTQAPSVWYTSHRDRTTRRHTRWAARLRQIINNPLIDVCRFYVQMICCCRVAKAVSHANAVLQSYSGRHSPWDSFTFYYCFVMHGLFVNLNRDVVPLLTIMTDLMTVNCDKFNDCNDTISFTRYLYKKYLICYFYFNTSLLKI